MVEPEPLKEYIIIMVVCEMQAMKKNRAKSEKKPQVIARKKW